MRRKKIDLPSLFWKDIKGYEGLYKVSVDGEMKSMKRISPQGHLLKERILKPYKDKDGYLRVNLYKDGKMKGFLVHRLVAQTWLPNPNNLPCINHKDENPLNNNVENLEFCSYQYNNNWGTHNERVAKALTNRKDLSKPVVALNKREQIVHVFPSANEAGRNGFGKSAVSECCKGKRKKHRNLYWYYQDDFLKKIC